MSDIDWYFNKYVVIVYSSITKKKNWMWLWWRFDKDDFLDIAAAVKNHLAIPASEVVVERLFNKAGDLLGLQRHSLSAETIRKLMLLRDMYINEETS